MSNLRADPDSEQIGLFWTSLCFGFFIYIPLCCYFTYEFYQLGDHPQLRKRHPQTVLWTNFHIICGILGMTLCFLPFLGYLPLIALYYCIGESMYCYLCSSWLLLYRFWLLSYEIGISKALIEDEWKSIIDQHYGKSKNKNKHKYHKQITNNSDNRNNTDTYKPATIERVQTSYNSKENDSWNVIRQHRQKSEYKMFTTKWYLDEKNIKTFGNTKWLRLRLFRFLTIIYIILVFTYVYVAIQVADGTEHKMPEFMRYLATVLQVFFLIFTAIPWPLMFFLWLYTPPYNDRMFVRQEMFALRWLNSISILGILVIITIIRFASNIRINNRADILQLVLYVYQPIYHFECITLIFTCYTTTRYVLKHTVYKNKHPTPKEAERNKNGKHDEQTLSLTKTLSNYAGYSAFSQFLSSEFAMENLLGYTEFTQFKMLVTHCEKRKHKVFPSLAPTLNPNTTVQTGPPSPLPTDPSTSRLSAGISVGPIHRADTVPSVSTTRSQNSIRSTATLSIDISEINNNGSNLNSPNNTSSIRNVLSTSAISMRNVTTPTSPDKSSKVDCFNNKTDNKQDKKTLTLTNEIPLSSIVSDMGSYKELMSILFKKNSKHDTRRSSRARSDSMSSAMLHLADFRSQSSSTRHIQNKSITKADTLLTRTQTITETHQTPSNNNGGAIETVEPIPNQGDMLTVIEANIQDSDNNNSDYKSSGGEQEGYIVEPVGVDEDNIDNKLCEMYHNKARLLYLKYIAVGSPFEINISSGERDRLRRLFETSLKTQNSTIELNDINNININEMKSNDYLKLFDKCCQTLLSLMNSPYRRFRETDEFSVLAKTMAPKHAYSLAHLDPSKGNENTVNSSLAKL